MHSSQENILATSSPGRFSLTSKAWEKRPGDLVDILGQTVEEVIYYEARRALGTNKACCVKWTKHKKTHCATVAEFKIETNYLSSLGRINRLDTNPVFRRHRRGSCVPFFLLLAINGACAYEVMFTLYQKAFRAGTKAFSSLEPVVSWSCEWHKSYLHDTMWTLPNCYLLPRYQDLHNQAYYMVTATSYWLAVRADLLCSVLITAVAFTFVLYTENPGK